MGPEAREILSKIERSDSRVYRACGILAIVIPSLEWLQGIKLEKPIGYFKNIEFFG